MNIEQRKQGSAHDRAGKPEKPEERRVTITIPGEFILAAFPNLVRRIKDAITGSVSKSDNQMK